MGINYHEVVNCGDVWSVFRGIHNVNVDAKGRMAIPARFRQRLAADDGRLVVTIDTEDPCLLVYPLSEWEVIEAKIEALPSFHAQTRRIKRLLIGHATEVEIDSQGRVLLPALLRERVDVDKKVMVVGQGKKLEIWSENAWQSSCDGWLDQDSGQPEGLPEALSDLSV